MSGVCDEWCEMSGHDEWCAMSGVCDEWCVR